jgi:hypothetical protein
VTMENCIFVFNRLVPFRQLRLHFSRNGKLGFYANIMDKMCRKCPAMVAGRDANQAISAYNVVPLTNGADWTKQFQLTFLFPNQMCEDIMRRIGESLMLLQGDTECYSNLS